MTLKEAIKKSGKLQMDIAKECEITDTSFSRYVKGDRTPNVITAVKIAECLGCTVDEIWGSGQSASHATFDGLKEYCSKCAETAHSFTKDWDSRMGKGDSEIGAIGALAYFMHETELYRYKIPSIIDAYLSERK